MTHDHDDTGGDDRPTDTRSVELARYDWRDSPTVLEAILATISDLDPAFDATSDAPLQSAVDVDALEGLFEPVRDEAVTTDTVLTFEYDSYTVTITAAGTVTAVYADAPHPYRSSR
ncbi:HalOD1 output domain-containing protein [Halorubellus litoreus]|uniref:HalOD1 output domain-containing protein n=1 Tax=Halorubellus litoreus TaxID=755308 RepID=A0ABD5VQ25_9EURY